VLTGYPAENRNKWPGRIFVPGDTLHCDFPRSAVVAEDDRQQNTSSSLALGTLGHDISLEMSRGICQIFQSC
jgi:hypothetical protein